MFRFRKQAVPGGFPFGTVEEVQFRPMQTNQTLETIHAERGGKSDAEGEFLRLLQAHQNQIFSYIFCQVQQAADAEDIFQQTAIVLWEKFSQFEPGSNFLAWAKAIATNKALAFLRDRRRSNARFSETLIEQLAERPLWSTETTDQKLVALSRCRQKLSSNDQQLLRECYGTAASKIQSTAAKLGRTAESVYVSLSRIRQSLANCIKRTLAQEELGS